MAGREGATFRQKMLLKQEPEDSSMLRQCWLLEVDSDKRLFVQRYDFKKTRGKGKLKLISTYWLYRYALDNHGLTLEGKALIGEREIKSDEPSVECGVVDGKVYIWVCEHLGRLRRKSTLRVAEWQNERELAWIECYTGSDARSPMSVDISSGSVAAIFERKQDDPYSSAIICQLPGYIPRSADLGHGFGGKHQLLHAKHGSVNWLLLNYEAWTMRILALDDKLQRVKQFEKSYPHSVDLHLVRGNEGSCYVVILMEDHVRIEKLQDFAGAQFVPAKGQQRGSEELSQQSISAAYKAYVEGRGKDLVKATNNQLAKDIVTGEGVSSLISYYRLLSRKKKSAERCLAERITNAIKEGVGQEHWLTDMELAFYGEPAIKPLLTLAATGAPEQRGIAVEALYMVPDLAVVNKLLTLLDKCEVRKDSPTCLMICDMGVRAGKLEAVDFLIKAATGIFMRKENLDAEQLLDESRRMLMELTVEYKDTPEDWSQESWNAWWKGHRGTIKLEREPDSKQAQRRKQFKRQHQLFQEVAKVLEKSKGK
jgi:hypothetical protein